MPEAIILSVSIVCFTVFITLVSLKGMDVAIKGMDFKKGESNG